MQSQCVLVSISPRSHRLSNQPLEHKLLFLQLVGRTVLDLKLCHRVAERSLDLLLVSALHLDAHAWITNDLLDAADVALKLLLRLELLGELVVAL